MLIKCKNPSCNLLFEEKELGKRGMKKYCSSTCGTRDRSYLRHLRIKDNPEYKKMKSDYFKNIWYPKNKKRQKENTLKGYYLHKDRWRCRTLNSAYRKEILDLFNNQCSCGNKESLIIKNKDFEKRPRRRKIEEWREFMKNHVVVMCKNCIIKKGIYKHA